MTLGLFNGALLKCFGYRKVAIFGGVLFSSGLVATSFADSFRHFLITYSIITCELWFIKKYFYYFLVLILILPFNCSNWNGTLHIFIFACCEFLFQEKPQQSIWHWSYYHRTWTNFVSPVNIHAPWSIWLARMCFNHQWNCYEHNSSSIVTATFEMASKECRRNRDDHKRCFPTKTEQKRDGD